jgi:ketosteroid isomerase-like protein
MNEDEKLIHALIERRANAFCDKDVETFLAGYAPDLVNFDLAPPLQYKGPDKDGLQDWFGTWRGSIGREARELSITVSGDVAFSHSLVRMYGTRTDGNEADVWFRETLGFRNIAGRWTITHEHSSVPLYMDGSNKAALDLKP